MTWKVLVALAVLSAPTAMAQDRDWEPPYAGEAGGALLGGVLVGAVASVAGGVIGTALDSGRVNGTWIPGGFIPGLLVGAALGYPVGCGLGTAVAGGVLQADGNRGGAFAGAFVGMGLGVLGWRLSGRNAEVGLVTMGALSPIGAAIGYNIGGGNEGTTSPFGARLSLPTVALKTRLGLDHQAHTAVDCRLVTMRF